MAVVCERPHALIDVPTHYCPGCTHGIVHRILAEVMDEMGIESSPGVNEKRSDIIQMIKLGTAGNMKRFCAGIQAGAPVDSYVTPEPWQMPGYDCPVIMAAGSFVQGSSIELSADGPFREPYTVYMQGGLTYESGRLGVMLAASAMLEMKE